MLWTKKGNGIEKNVIKEDEARENNGWEETRREKEGNIKG